MGSSDDTEQSDDNVSNGGDEQTSSHEAAYVRMVGKEAVDELTDSIGKEERGGDDTELFGIKDSGIHDGFLDYVKGCPAYVVHTIAQSNGYERRPLHSFETGVALLFRFVT